MNKLIKSSVATLGFMGIALQSHAQVTAVSSAAALPTTDYIGWGQLGPNLATVSSPSSVTSELGLAATVSSGGPLDVRVSGTGWTIGTIFPTGDKLLYNQDNGNVTINFSTPVSGAGAAIQDALVGQFTASIAAYDGATLLGTESFSSTASDGPPIFAGLDSDSADITSVVFSITSGGNGNDNNFAIDTLDLNTGPTVPDASSTASLLGIATLGLSLFRKKLNVIES